MIYGMHILLLSETGVDDQVQVLSSICNSVDSLFYHILLYQNEEWSRGKARYIYHISELSLVCYLDLNFVCADGLIKSWPFFGGCVWIMMMMCFCQRSKFEISYWLVLAGLLPAGWRSFLDSNSRFCSQFA